MSSEIAITRAGDITHIRLDRPAKRNALTSAMYASMAAALEAAETDGTAIVLFSAEGQGFCAGNDLGDFLQPRPDEQEQPVHRFLRAIASSSRILIAAVQGRAVGVGTTMLFHCDFVIAEQDAILHMPFTDLGLVPEAASSLLVPRILGHHRAAGLLLMGDPLPAAEAHAWGLVREVVPPGKGLAHATALAETLAAKPRHALLTARRLMKAPDTGIAARMQQEGEAFAAQLKTPEFRSIAEKFFASRSKVA